MKDPIAEARFQLYLALEGVRQSNDPDSIPGTEYAELLLKSADAYALAAHDDTCEGCSYYIEGSPAEAHTRATCQLRARIGQGQSHGNVQQDVPSGPDTKPGS